MLKHILLAACLSGPIAALAANPQTCLAHDLNAPANAEAMSVGHNLAQKRAALANTDAATMKPAPAKAKPSKRGISAFGPRPASRATQIDHSADLLFESFESCQHESDALPAGWQNISNGTATTGAKDHWIGFSSLYSMWYGLPMPADGDMMAIVYYNDDAYKDEWLVSPVVEIPDGGYELSFFWYTIPLYLYQIDSSHVDFTTGKFTDRVINFNFEVLCKADQGDWVSVYDFEKHFSDMDYSDISMIDYEEMQRASVNLDDLAGKSAQFAFRYYGKEGNSMYLDAISVGKQSNDIDVRYMPDLSRLFYGFSPDQYISWSNHSIEFYPANSPINWYNISKEKEGVSYSWSYSTLDDNGELAYVTDDSDQSMLSVEYAPDYTSRQTLMNNFYLMPKLTAQADNGNAATFTDRASLLQAGGTPELDLGEENGGYIKFSATNFDINTEGFGIHVEDDDDLGFWAEPIFGHTANTDAWWEHYCYPNGMTPGKYAYIDGFANMYFPHPNAPMVINGVSAVAKGTIYPEAEFWCRIYTMTEDGYIIEEPIAQKSIRGTDVLSVPSGSTQKYLVLNFPLDLPVIFDAQGTGYGYFVEISGYRDDKIEYFAPVQSLVPNEHEWCLGFYRCYSYYNNDITQQMSYVAFFKNDEGQDLYTSFAIGLDAHYPWLDTSDAPRSILVESNPAEFIIKGYYDASAYTVDAPEWLDVSLAGRYETTVKIAPNDECDYDRNAKITISAPAVEYTADVTVKANSMAGSIISQPSNCGNVYNTQGIMVLRNADEAALRQLPAGIYIHNGRKVSVK